ncbi:hypothetical protein HAX54_034083 [Datura stramonium]|uniref:PNPLA domain-containing protein n=1 Tax=Datura stramonium TaxID=4076 RepID=A0ABS8SDX6_DATST|nr:hypothetical protein [Datura stramonium]
MKQTLTQTVIPAFDIKRLQPIVFTTTDAKTHVSKDARLSDICLSTSAAPTYFPVHYFETKDAQGALIAITHISKEIMLGKLQYEGVKPMDSKKMLVLSLGTGIGKEEKKYSAAAWRQRKELYLVGCTTMVQAHC